MTRTRIIGLSFTTLGIAMFIFGAGMFTYRGQALNPIIYELGKYSFLCWIPVLGIGIVLVIVGGKKKDLNNYRRK